MLVAMRTPPFNVILSLIAPEFAAVAATEALELIASDLWSRYHETLPGVNAPVPVARLFAERWQAADGADGAGDCPGARLRVGNGHPGGECAWIIPACDRG